jgi:hypothetical protein
LVCSRPGGDKEAAHWSGALRFESTNRPLGLLYVVIDHALGGRSHLDFERHKAVRAQEFPVSVVLSACWLRGLGEETEQLVADAGDRSGDSIMIIRLQLLGQAVCPAIKAGTCRSVACDRLIPDGKEIFS